MFTLKAQNKYGQILELTHNEAYVITNITGIDPPEGIINTTRNAAADGSVFNSAYVNDRTIIITLSINEPAEENRINLYKYFKSKQPVRLFYSNGSRDVYIDGYVKKMPIEYFAKKQIAQITVFCPNPYFMATGETITNFSSVQGLFEFPFSIETPIEFGVILLEQEHNILNRGDVETGALFVMTATGAVSTPSIYNVETGEYLTLNISLQAGDEVRINTIKKQKSIIKISNGVATNIIGSLKNGSTWLQLAPADNIFTTSAEQSPENLEVYCVLTGLYEGV